MNKESRNVLIIGGGGGLGRAIVERLLSEGNTTLYVVDASAESLKLLPENVFVRKILNNLETIEHCRNIVEEIPGGIDCLIHLAGTIEKDLIMNEDSSLWERVIDSNLKTAYQITGEVMKKLPKTGQVNFLYFSGIAYRRGAYENIAYSIAKAGIVGLVRSVAKRLGARGVVNALCPGVVMTEPLTESATHNNVSKMMNEYLERHGDRVLSQIPMKRFGKPEEVAEAALYFCSEKCSYITGQVINIDGGIINS